MLNLRTYIKGMLLLSDPIPEGMQKVKGIFTGGCVGYTIPGPKNLGPLVEGHAHTDGPWAGWICTRFKGDLVTDTVLWHEYAHILAGPGVASHGKVWKQKMAELGQPIPMRYYQLTAWAPVLTVKEHAWTGEWVEYPLGDE